MYVLHGQVCAFVRRGCMRCATIGEEPGDALQTGGDDVTRIDCDQACLVLTQVCHQMTDDDRR